MITIKKKARKLTFIIALLLTLVISLCMAPLKVSAAGLFDAKFGKGQIFDVVGRPSGGGLSNFGNPYDSSVGSNGWSSTGRQFTDSDLNDGRYFQFKLTEDTSNPFGLYFYNSDGTPVNKSSMTETNPLSNIADDGLVNTGKITHLGNNGLFFESSNYYGYFISGNTGFSNGDSVSTEGWLADPSLADLEKTIFCDVPLLANQYSVMYQANAGEDKVTDMPSTQVKDKDKEITLSSNTPQREGYSFLGWSTTSIGNVEYQSGGSYAGNESLSLYAIWQKASPETPIPTEYLYSVLKSFGTFTGNEQISATVEADHTAFVKLVSGDTEIDPDNYEITEGSTIITLKEGYLKTLGNDSYSYEAIYENGRSEIINLDVNAQTDVDAQSQPQEVDKPQTGDTDITLIIAASLFVGSGIVWILTKFKKGAAKSN